MQMIIFETRSDRGSRFVRVSLNEEYDDQFSLENMTQYNELGLRFESGSVAGYSSVVQTVAGSQMVVTLAGIPATWASSQAMLAAHSQIIRAMAEQGISRLITIGAPRDLYRRAASLPPDYPFVLGETIIPAAQDDLTTIRRWAEAFSVDWTYIALPFARNGNQFLLPN